MSGFEWTEQDQRAVDTARVLAADAVEKVGNGHPGAAISLAPLGYLLYHKLMKVDPKDDLWIGRDRFLLSVGHASLLQYTQLYLAGLDLELDDLKALRTFESKTPGHPEFHHTKFVEATSGPLGAGISNAVGMAMAARRERGLFDPDASEGESPFDHFVYVVAGDGCLQEGVASEASSLAGTQNLGNLILFYDDNRITIEGKTPIAFTEDVDKRYESYGWHVQHVDFTNGGSGYQENMQALFDAIVAAQQVTDKPSIIRVTTVIGWPLPKLAGTAQVHGAKLGPEEITGLKEGLGFPDNPFDIDEQLVADVRARRAERSEAERRAWDEKFGQWREANPERAALLDRIQDRELPKLDLPVFTDEKMSTRKASGKVLSALASQMPELWGGSADLAGSNNTAMAGEPSFLPAERVTDEWPGNEYGRNIHFGIREHAMGGALNGINLSGLTRAYGGTFFVFADYMRPAVRLAAIMGIGSIFVWSHDSIGVGEDGPTHQPVEHLAAYRAIPGLAIVRPADANETAEAWRGILEHKDSPSGIILTRQDVPIVDRGDGKCAPAAGVLKGAYVLRDASGEPKVILIGTGSEVQLALAAQEQLEAEGIPTRVVSMPCQEWFDEQPQEYRDEVLPASVTARVSVEAGIALGWERYVGDKGVSISLEHFGASGKGTRLMQEYGFTADAVAQAARGLVK